VPLTRTRGTHSSTPHSACAFHAPFPRSEQAQQLLLEYDAAVTRSRPQTGQWVYMIDFLDRFDEPTPSAVYMRSKLKDSLRLSVLPSRLCGASDFRSESWTDGDGIVSTCRLDLHPFLLAFIHSVLGLNGCSRPPRPSNSQSGQYQSSSGTTSKGGSRQSRW
jgi:hypothetical protein